MTPKNMFDRYLDKWTHFLEPKDWESTFLRRLWLVLFPITVPLWFALTVLTVVLLIVVLLILVLPAHCAVKIYDTMWKKR